MKSKRFLCLLLVLLMVFSLTPSETRAETTVYFTAVNDQLLPDLSDETMPFWSGGRLYIPSTVITGTDLGLFYSRSRDKSTAVVYRQGTDVQLRRRHRRRPERPPVQRSGHRAQRRCVPAARPFDAVFLARL